MPFWASVHSLTFSVVPLRLRIAWASTAAVAWTAYMSSLNQQACDRESKRGGGGEGASE